MAGLAREQETKSVHLYAPYPDTWGTCLANRDNR